MDDEHDLLEIPPFLRRSPESDRPLPPPTRRRQFVHPEPNSRTRKTAEQIDILGRIFGYTSAQLAKIDYREADRIIRRSILPKAWSDARAATLARRDKTAKR